jgi:hypothetical protein
VTAEEWRPVPGWEDAYWWSSEGRIASVRILTPQPNSDGYPQVRLHRGGRSWFVAVHQLIMLGAEGPPPAGPDGKLMEVLHRNGKPGDVRRRNLRYGTKAENRADRERHKRTRAGRGKVEQKGKQKRNIGIDGNRFLSPYPGVAVSEEAPP